MMLSIMAVACASESDQSVQNAADNPSENATSEDAIESALSPSVGSGTAELSEPNAEVGRVVDGDTIVAMIDGAEERIRFIGIDTPESVKPNSPVECFGKEASAHLAEYLPPGTPLVLVRDVEARDRYDRLLAYVYRASDGLFVNMQMMLDGYAQPATYPPNVAHTDQFLAASRQAREAELGLWSACEGE